MAVEGALSKGRGCPLPQPTSPTTRFSLHAEHNSITSTVTQKNIDRCSVHGHPCCVHQWLPAPTRECERHCLTDSHGACQLNNGRSKSAPPAALPLNCLLTFLARVLPLQTAAKSPAAPHMVVPRASPHHNYRSRLAAYLLGACASRLRLLTSLSHAQHQQGCEGGWVWWEGWVCLGCDAR